jgi:hypothetical protein
VKLVILSVEDEHRERCVDFVHQADGSCVYRLYRKEPEDHGRWSLVADYAAVTFADLESAYISARSRIPWLPEALPCPARSQVPKSSG